MTVYPEVRTVIAIHDNTIRETGGLGGIRDIGALESAILRPQTGYYDDLLEEAAALMESLAMNHPFLDGNKRTAFLTTDAFLRINGLEINCDSAEAHAFLIGLFETHSFNFENLHLWLVRHTAPLPS